MPYYYEDKLKNGLRLLTIPASGTKTVTLLVLVPTGSRHESKAIGGLSHFIEHMMFKGTDQRLNTAMIAGELDAIGGEYNAFTTKEYTGYYVKAASEKIELGTEVLSDIILNSKFASEEIEREKGTIIEEYNMIEDNPMIRVEDIFENCLYGDTPLGRDIIGTKETIRSFKRQDFLGYFRRQYSSDRAIVCIAGNITRKASNSLAERYFSAWPKKPFKDGLAVSDRQSRPELKIVFKKTDQIHLAIGVRSFKSGHPDELAAKLLAVILGGSMSSRLFLELRERRGLAYYVHAATETYADAGYLCARAGIQAGKLEESLKVILGEYRRIAAELVPKSELQRAKDMIIGRLAIQLEASDDLASWYGRQALQHQESLTPASFIKKIKSLKAADLQRVAKQIFQDKNLNLAAIGPIKNSSAILKKLSLK